MTEQKEALKPCPICGAAPMANGGPGRGAFGYLCAQTGHRLQTYGATRAEAITAWNTRSQPPVAVPGELVEMREALDRVRKVRDGYASQAKFCDIEPLPYFREFIRRIDKALTSTPVDETKD